MLGEGEGPTQKQTGTDNLSWREQMIKGDFHFSDNLAISVFFVNLVESANTESETNPNNNLQGGHWSFEKYLPHKKMTE